MNITFNFKAAGFNATDLFSTTAAATVGGTPVTGSVVGNTEGAGAAAALTPALPGLMPDAARPLFADALGTVVHASEPVGSVRLKTDEADQPPADGMPSLPQASPLPSMAAPWLPAQVTAAAPVAALQGDDDSDGGNDLAARAALIAAGAGAVPVAATPVAAIPVDATPVAAPGIAAAVVKKMAATEPVAMPATVATAVASIPGAVAVASVAATPAATAPAMTIPVATVATAAAAPETAHAATPQAAMAGTARDTTAPATTTLAVRPASMQFNAQLGTMLPAPRLGEPLEAATPARAGEKTAAPAVHGKIVQAAVEATAPAVQPVVVAATMPVAAPGTADMTANTMAPAIPASSGVSASPSQPASVAGPDMPAAAVLPAILANNTRDAAAIADARPALRPHAGPADNAGMAPRTGTAGVSFAAPVASAMVSQDAERGAASITTVVAPAASAVLTAAAAAGAPPAQGGDIIKLNGTAQQWQEPLREALGERLQTQIGRNSEHAVIRLDPPMLGRIDISIRHTAGTLQVNVSASNAEVLRQLQGIGETMRNDLAQRQYTEVAVNISATPRSQAAQAFAEGDARGQRQPGRQQDEAEPGRALSDGTPADTRYSSTFAMHEREYN